MTDKVTNEEVFVIKDAQKNTQGDGNEGREGTFDTEWDYNADN